MKARNVVSTGWKVIDDMTRGGLAGGELGVVIDFIFYQYRFLFHLRVGVNLAKMDLW